jgi:hypothetical protein
MKCDGTFIGFIDNFVVEIFNIVEDSSTGATYWDGAIGWQSYFPPKPIFIPKHIDYLNGNCADVVNFDIQSIVDANDFRFIQVFPLVAAGFRRTPKYLCHESYITLEAQYITTGVPGSNTYTFTGTNTQLSPLDNVPIDQAVEVIIQSGGSNFCNFEKPFNINQVDLTAPPAHETYHCAIDINDIGQIAGSWVGINREAFDPGFGFGNGNPVIVHDIDAFEVFDYVDLRPSFQDNINPVLGVCNVDANNNPTGEYTITVPGVLNADTRIIQYQIQINGVPGPWLDSNVFQNVPPGIHVVLIRDFETTCVNQVTISTALIPC